MNPATVQMRRKASFKVLLIVSLLLSTFFGNFAGTVNADPELSRVPANPYPSPAADSTLAKHDLTYAPSPLDNPLKGFAPFYPWETETSFPHSLEWVYVPLKAVMNGPDSYTFDTGLTPALNAIAARGNQAAVRVYLEYPGREDAIPEFIHQSGVAMRHNDTFNQVEPDYDDPAMVTYLTNFIRAFGAQYDGDPRIAYIHMGLVGLWGEWHTYPYDEDDADGLPNYMPGADTIRTLFTAYDTAFNQTKLEVRYPGLPGASEFNFGYHDDSFGYKEGEPLQSVTQPESMGGAYYSFLTKMLEAGSENKWITQSVGGEVRPEIQNSFFSGGSNVDNAIDDIELTHASWMINQGGISSYNASDETVAAGVRKMGYDLNVASAYYNDVAQGDPLKVGVTVQNHGVAPFAYPWKVELGVKNLSGQLVKKWDTSWDLTKVMPLEIRTYPEWNLPGDPKVVPFGESYYFDTSITSPGLEDGHYYLVMKVVNPLESISAKAKQVRFANADQGTDGWLNLGPVLIGEDDGTTPPTSPPLPPKRLVVDNYDGTPAWSGSTQNDLGQWTGSSGFANGNGAGVIEEGALVLQVKNMSRLETNIGRNLSDTGKLVIRVKGAAGGEENLLSLSIGGVTKTLAGFSGDTVSTGYKDIVIDLAAQGVDLTQTIWSVAVSQAVWDAAGTVYIDEIYFTDKVEYGGGPGTDPGPGTDLGNGSAAPGLIENFESYGDDAALRQAWTEAWSDKPGSVARALGQASGSKGLKLSAAIPDAEWANIIHAIPAELRDWSKYDGLSFWVDNTTTDNKNFSLNVALQTPVANGEFSLKEGGSALTADADGSWQPAAFNGGSLNVPAGFKGVVRIPWDQFAQSAWQFGDAQVESTALDPSEVTGLQFGYPPAGYAHNVITIDDIRLYRADKVLEDFESYTDDAALQSIWRVDWESGEPSALRTLDKVNVSDGTQAMKFSVSPPPGKEASDWVNIKRAAFTGADSDWSAFDGFTFWVNHSSGSKNMDLNISLVTDAPKGEFSLKAGGTVKLYNAAEGWKDTVLGGGSLPIAPGYTGMVRIPWSAFAQSAWQGCDACSAVFDASKVLQIQFGYGPKNQAGNVLSIDRVGLYALAGRTGGSGGGTETPPVDHPSAPDWATSDGTYALAYSQAPVDNPLKGFLPFYDAAEEAYFKEGDDWRDRETQLPYSLEFFYLPLSRLMNNLDDFDWSELDKRLAAVAARGNQSVFRVYLDYPNKPSGIPQFLLDQGLKTYTYTEFDNGKDATSLAPDYNDERLLGALDNFIGALGERYDGDPRVGALMIGLIGFWGEWHTYPYDGNLKSPNLMPTDANLRRVLTAVDNAFDETQLVLRYPMNNSTLKTGNFDVGYHDDSFAFQTLPPSLGGQGWHFWGRVNDAGVTEFWKKNAMGGEMRPEIQVKMWNNDPPRYNEPSTPIEGAQGEDYYTSLNLTHASWLIAQGIFQTPLEAAPLARATEGSRSMGYEYYVPAAYLDAPDGKLKVGVELENRGVAPFYYNWKVELAAKSGDDILQIWSPDWDLKDILPNTNGFDQNKLFVSADNPQLSNGSYDILLRYINPLEQVNADARKFHFANAGMDEAGWLNLGSVEIADSTAGAPVRVTGLTADVPEQLRLAPGAAKQIEVTVAPANAGNKRVVWSSDNLAVAYVSATGLVTATGEGRAVIKAKTADGNLERQFEVTVAAGSGSEPTPTPTATPPAATPTPAATSSPAATPPAAVTVPAATPLPSSTPAGQAVLMDVKTASVNGVTETTAAVDARKLRDAFTALKNSSAAASPAPVIIKLDNDGGNVTVNIPASAFDGVVAELPEASIVIQTDAGSYTLPVKTLGIAALAAKLGVNPADMTISISIDRVTGGVAEVMAEQAGAEGLRLLTPALDYEITAQANGKSVRLDSFGSTYVERTLIVPGTVDPQITTALLFNPDTGSYRFVPALLVNNGGNTEAVIKRNGNSIYVVASGKRTFGDLQGHWARADIELLASKRVIYGVAVNSFAPDLQITRAEFAAILARSLGLSPLDQAAAFKDVAAGAWYAKELAATAEAGIITGFSDGSFRPDDVITREQIAVMLSRALEVANPSVPAGDADAAILGKYTDHGSVSAWAQPAVAKLLNAGIIQGKSAAVIDPAAPASRAEAAVMIKRLLQSAQLMN